MKERALPGVVAAVAILSATTAVAQPAAAIQVTGTELQAWFEADEMAVAGINLANGCHWLIKGRGNARSQTAHCPNSTPFTVTGEARVEGNRLCSKFTYPDGSRFGACTEIYRIGDNKFEARLDGVPRNVFYRLVR